VNQDDRQADLLRQFDAIISGAGRRASARREPIGSIDGSIDRVAIKFPNGNIKERGVHGTV
jgi:hypothetical protein